MPRKLNAIDWIALVLVIIGAINWGIVGLFKLDLVGLILGGTTAILARIVFTLVGLSGLWVIYTLVKITSIEQSVQQQQRHKMAGAS